MTSAREGWPDPDKKFTPDMTPGGWQRLGSAEIEALTPDERRQREDGLVAAYVRTDSGVMDWYWYQLACLVGYNEAHKRCDEAWRATWPTAPVEPEPTGCDICGKEKHATPQEARACRNRRYRAKQRPSRQGDS